MTDKGERKPPSQATLRRLFVNSGNRCAFPNCDHILVDENGKFKAQVCHIEAAKSGGERFNPKTTDEQRRDYDNLILFCYDHHIETNDVIEYPVERLKLIKRDHEEKFSRFLSEMADSFFKDITEDQLSKKAQSLKRMNEVLHWGNTEEDLKLSAETINKNVELLTKITKDTRSLFSIAVKRSENNVVMLDEILRVTNISQVEFLKQIAILRKYKLVGEPEFDQEYMADKVELGLDSETSWDIWNDIKKYCNETKIDIGRIIMDLEFNLLD